MILTIFQSCKETGLVLYVNVVLTADISVCQKCDNYDMKTSYMLGLKEVYLIKR